MNKTILITGASSGIGKATALFFLKQGWNVVATMREVEEEKELINSDTCLVVFSDVTNLHTLEDSIDRGIEKFGTVDVLVNNAGYGLLGPLELSSVEQVQKQFDTNLFSIVNAIRIITPHFRTHGGGMIINLSSMMGRITLPFFSLYSATKFAVEGLSAGLYYEFKNQNIVIKLIEPGTIKTNFLIGLKTYEPI